MGTVLVLELMSPEFHLMEIRLLDSPGKKAYPDQAYVFFLMVSHT